MRRIFSILLISVLSFSAYADSLNSLTLSDTEMQKLKKFFPNQDDESHLQWKGDPIAISLGVGQEKRIIFPVHVSVDLKSALNTDQLRILNDDKSIYLTALKPFPSTRIYVSLKDSGEVVLIDLATSDSVSSATQYIDIKSDNPVVKTVSEQVENTPAEQSINNDENYADLVRFAWQEMYAPERLQPHSMAFTRSPMHTQKFVSDLVYGDKVIAFPIGSWTSGNHYVTAIMLRNKYQHKTEIKIQQDICGDWQAATLYPRTILQAYGNKNKDSTTLFLVSTHPFGDTLGVCHGDA